MRATAVSAAALLALPLLAVPIGTADAATDAGTAFVIRNCLRTTADGVTLRIRLRFDMRSATDPNDIRLMRVRVSHPDGRGKFRHSKVDHVSTRLIFESQPAPSSPGGGEIGTAVFAVRRGDGAIARARPGRDLGSAAAAVTFTLVNGKRVGFSCTQTFPED